MQLTFTILGSTRSVIINDILPLISGCSCNILELRYSHLSCANASYFLVEGNWNKIAKLESSMESMSKKKGFKIRSMRLELVDDFDTYMPYSLETVAPDKKDLVRTISNFLNSHNIQIVEINGSQYLTTFSQTPIFSLKFTILIPQEVSILGVREEFLDFCDRINIDAILEPIKK